MSISIIIPTLNEEENIKKVIVSVRKALHKIKHEIIVVDDESYDKTVEIAKKLSVKVITRKSKRGLASAVLKGFEIANEDTFCVLDADMQHPPQMIPKMYELFTETNADIVIGSRYVEGGVVRNWSFFRHMTSHVATTLTRLILKKTRNIKDPLSGFFIIKKNVITSRVNPIGYKLLLEILINGKYSNIKEIPYTFEGRKGGRSKLGLSQILKFIKHLSKLNWKQKELKRGETS